MTIKRKQRLRIQAASGAAPVLDEQLATFEGPAYTGGVMYPRQAPDGVVIDLAGMEIPSQELISTREHNPLNVVGQTTRIENDRSRLYCAGVLTGTDDTVLTTARRAKTAGTRAPWQFSVDAEYDRDDVEWIREGRSVVVNGQRITGPMPIVRRSVLRRIDFVTKGGDRKAWASIKAAGGESTMTFEEWLASLGFTDPTALSDDQRTKLQAFYDEEVAETTEQESDPAAMEEQDNSSIAASSGRGASTLRRPPARNHEQDVMQSIRQRRTLEAAEASRISDIREVCKRYDNPSFMVQGKRISLEAHAIEQGWSKNDTELEALRESRPTAPAGQTRTIEASADALVMSQLMRLDNLKIENAVPRRLQIEAAGDLPEFLFWDVNDDRKQQLLEAAQGFSGLNSVDFAREAIELNGSRIGRGTRGVLEAAGSSASFSNIISTTAKTAITMSFKTQKDTTENWCEVDDGPTFLSTPVVGMKVPGGELSPLRDGEAKYGHLSDKGEPIQVTRFAEQINVDETTLINDQLGVIVKTLGGPEGYGVKASNTRPGLIYSIIKANAALSDSVAIFHASRGNYQTGSPLSSTTLAAAVALLQLAGEVGADGLEALLQLDPTHMLIPPTLFTLAGALADSEYLGAIAASQVPTGNPFLDFNLQRLSEARLEKTTRHTLTGEALTGSSADWYLVSATAPPFLCRYLQATGRVPRVRTEPLTKGRWGINVDVSFDIGVACIRPQAIVKSRAS